MHVQLRLWNWLLCLACVVLMTSGSDAASKPASGRPNIIMIFADDVSWNDLGCYGHPTIRTPHLDRLAKEGLRFDNAYLTTSSCSPSRCSVITGRYPHNTGAPELHTPLPEEQVLFPQLLRDAGYYTVISGKQHMGKYALTAFDHVSKGKGPGREADWVPILKQRPKDKPFFCWFASVDAHRAWQASKEYQPHKPEDVVVPPYLIDAPETRKDLAQYYDEISRIDFFTGKILDELDAQGIADNTLVLFFADNGRPFPRCKTRLYDSGIKTPLMVRWPAAVKPGTVTNSLVSSIDIGPTFLDLAGVPPDPRIQGVSFQSVLKQPTVKVRDYAFAEHNWHVFKAHERMVRSGDLLYIRNAWPEQRNLCVESIDFPSGEVLWQRFGADKLNEFQRDVFLKPRPAEELYLVTEDPHQFHNLAAKTEYAADLSRLRKVLDQWTAETGDTVPKNPTLDRNQRPGEPEPPEFAHREMPGDAKQATTINAPGPILVP
ncbi:sulfatase [uncultured Gimesia sp.]|uniref:sulfatase family protein n=1 Tax=uncultured Gimesia sp. TaxID=1678688 RepID=UPI0030DA62B4|tara:strand:- start:95261 stop:96727 length:1467 start_codon:yes stop_codon:yes gene_type:complete